MLVKLVCVKIYPVTQLICVHSFRGGTGKSNLSSNLGCLLARRGCRVAVVDTDIQSPGVHVLFGLSEDAVGLTVNDFLWERCALSQAAHDVTPVATAQGGAEPGTQLFLVPSSMKSIDIARVVRDGYDVSRLDEGLQELSSSLDLDYLILDTHPGLNEETLLLITIADTVLVVLRPDNQDFQGTSVVVEVARKLEVPKLLLVVNMTPAALEREALRQRVQEVYGASVAGVLPLSEEVAYNASSTLFSLTHPEHPWSQEIVRIASHLLD